VNGFWGQVRQLKMLELEFSITHAANRWERLPKGPRLRRLEDTSSKPIDEELAY
jgi:hypothetical protein